MSRVGLVTTFRFAPCRNDASVERCWSVLSSFLLYHLAKGIDHVFLFADADDNSNDIFIGRVAQDFHSSQVSVDVRSDAQKERQRATCRLWETLGSFSDSEVPARQSLNAEEALWRAADMNLDWLLHLDIDELFYTEAPSVKPHFDHLNQLGVQQMTYVNHEAVPTCEHVDNYFTEVELFRINHLILPLSHKVGECTHFWRQRRSHGQYMLAYDNGKAAVRVLPGRIVPQSVHRWKALKSEESDASQHATRCDAVEDASCKTVRELEYTSWSRDVTEDGRGQSSKQLDIEVGNRTETQSMAEETCGQGVEKPNTREQRDATLVSRSAMADPRELLINEVLECSDPCVLHYPSCGLDWLQDKYRLLGRFPSSWFGGKLTIAPCFHLDARDAMVDLNGTLDNGRELYKKEVMLCPDEHAEEMQEQLEHGVLQVIEGAATTIRHARDSKGDSDMSGTPPLVLTAQLQSEGKSADEQQRDGQTQRSAREIPRSSKHLPSASHVIDEQSKSGNDKRTASTGNTLPETAFENSWILAAVARDYL